MLALKLENLQRKRASCTPPAPPTHTKRKRKRKRKPRELAYMTLVGGKVGGHGV
jgi:hypothetical protein